MAEPAGLVADAPAHLGCGEAVGGESLGQRDQLGSEARGERGHESIVPGKL
ncbi:MAG TPA: hypothetical protein VLN26_10755 [Gaiellaceae bacterium]|nr:hypothetical protein [Gaiellaceae bacterium]